MRLPQPFLGGLALGLMAFPTSAAPPPTPYERTMAPYVAQLDRQCPGRRAEYLSPGDLELIMVSFEDRLTRAQRHEIGGDVGPACAQTAAGLGCETTNTLRSLARLGLLPRFAAAVCASHWRCTARGECVQTRH